jgi:integrase/recombinase XerD
MNPCSPTDADLVEGFLRLQRFRNRTSRRVYACILRGFLRFVRTHTGGASPTTELVQQWLNDRIQQWPLHLVCHRACVVDRFLEWMKCHGAAPNNPFAELRQQYGQRVAPIVRALVSEDSAAALLRLRSSPRYGSFLGPLMREQVERMRSVGYRYECNENALLRFDRFLQRRPDLAGAPLRALLDAWRGSNQRPRHRLEVSQVGRVLSKAMHRLDPAVAILPVDRDAARQVKQLERRPYIYTEAQILQLLEVTQTFESSLTPLRALSLYTMVLLTYCAGLRIGELVRLTLGDVDLENDTLEIRGTKFFKSRRLPLAAGVITAVRHYLAARQQAGAPSEPASGLFWKDPRGGSYSCAGARNLLVAALRRAGLKPVRGKIGPRVHDLRHAMVCNRMLTWYRDGINPQSRLPHLATYLGHKDINSTLVYLTVTQELMQHASERFRVHSVAALGSAGGQP